MISAMRIKWRSKIILVGKTDLDDAYQHIHMNAYNASKCISIEENLIVLCLCLPFGKTPATLEYTAVGKSAIYLGNDLLRDKLWDATKIQSPYEQIIGEEECHKGQDPILQSDQLAVDIKV